MNKVISTKRQEMAGSVSLAIAFALLSVSSMKPAMAADAASQDNSDGSLQEIIVTAEKRSQSVVAVPATVNVFSEKTLTNLNIQSFDDYAVKVPNLAFNKGQIGQAQLQGRGVTIRGMVGSNTTSLYIDDTPIPVTNDPRIVDVARIEVLKGPQGTLYGSDAIGGTIRIITNQPSFNADEPVKYMVQGGSTEHGGSPDFGGSFSGNMVLVPDRLAVRLMGYVNHDAGYIRRTFPVTTGSPQRTYQDDTGAKYEYGAMAAATYKFTDAFDANLKLLGERNEYPNGLPLVYRGTGASFDPDSLVVNRDYNRPEQSKLSWYLPALTLNYKADKWSAVSSTSFYNSNMFDAQDVSEAMHHLLGLGFFGNITNFDSELGGGQNSRQNFQQEFRFAFQPTSHFNGLVGAYYAHNVSKTISARRSVPAAVGVDSPATGLITTDVYFWLDAKSTLEEKALFTQLNYTFFDSLTATAGLRKYWIDNPSINTSWGFIIGNMVPVTDTTNFSNTGVSPKFSLSYTPNADTNIYASAAKGFRPGGPGATLPLQCQAQLQSLGQDLATARTGYQPDSVWSYELGGKLAMSNQRLLLTGAVFDTEWKNIQQTVSLDSCGISFLSNAGAAQVKGVEVELVGNVTRDLALRAGYGYTSAKITDDAGGTTNQAVGSRLYGVPSSNATLSAIYTHPINDTYMGFASADWSYTGSSLSVNNSSSNPAELGAYQLVNVRFGIRRDTDEFSLYVNNVTDKLAALGDSVPDILRSTTINGVPNTPYPQVFVTTPRTIGLQYRHGF